MENLYLFHYSINRKTIGLKTRLLAKVGHVMFFVRKLEQLRYQEIYPWGLKEMIFEY